MNARQSTTAQACRSCGSSELAPFLDLGETPLSDGLLAASDLDHPEPTFPLCVAFCRDCSLVQILETVSPELLFTGNYPYFSSVSDAFVAHARTNALDLIERRQLGPSSLCVELAGGHLVHAKYFPGDRIRGQALLDVVDQRHFLVAILARYEIFSGRQAFAYDLQIDNRRAAVKADIAPVTLDLTAISV